MTDLSNAIVTDFTEDQWKYLDKKQKRQVEANTPKHVLRVWRGEKWDRGTSFKWTTWVFVILPALFLIVCAGIPALYAILNHYDPDPTPAQKLEAEGPRTEVNADGMVCSSKHCEGGYATVEDWAKANPDNPRAAQYLH